MTRRVSLIPPEELARLLKNAYIPDVARAVGLSYTTIVNVRDGRGGYNYNTIVALTKYLTEEA